MPNAEEADPDTAAGTMVDRTQLSEHLQFFQELGVEGFRREPEWRTRAVTEASARQGA